MATRPQLPFRVSKPVLIRGLAGLTTALLLSACADAGILDAKPQLALADTAADTDADEKDVNATPQTELQKATLYWGQEYAKTPGELKPALNYAKNLKAMGEKKQALSVLQQASNLHSKDPELASEYGRLALDLDQIAVAQKYLEFADNPAKPDWRVISARGTALAKQGQYKEAIGFYERALALQPNQSSILNNLAMAQAASGNPTSAEGLLRQAITNGDKSAMVQQNLALVLGLQGRYDEAKTTVASSLPADSAKSNSDYIRSMVKLPAKAAPVAIDAFKTDVTAGQASAQMKPTAIDTAAAGQSGAWTASVASASAAQPTKPMTSMLKGSAQ